MNIPFFKFFKKNVTSSRNLISHVDFANQLYEELRIQVRREWRIINRAVQEAIGRPLPEKDIAESQHLFILAVLALEMYYLDLKYPDKSFYIKTNLFNQIGTTQEQRLRTEEKLKLYTELIYQDNKHERQVFPYIHTLAEKLIRDLLKNRVQLTYFKGYGKERIISPVVIYAWSAMIYRYYGGWNRLVQRYIVKLPPDYD